MSAVFFTVRCGVCVVFLVFGFFVYFVCLFGLVFVWFGFLSPSPPADICNVSLYLMGRKIEIQ